MWKLHNQLVQADKKYQHTLTRKVLKELKMLSDAHKTSEHKKELLRSYLNIMLNKRSSVSKVKPSFNKWKRITMLLKRGERNRNLSPIKQ